MKKMINHFFLLFLLIILISGCNNEKNINNICSHKIKEGYDYKPIGSFTSQITDKSISNPYLNGGLVRVTWAEIEPSPGVYNFSKINDQISKLPSNKLWSLAIHGGYSSLDESDPDLYDSRGRRLLSSQMSPSWLEGLGVETFSMNFRNVSVNMPKYWDKTLLEKLKNILLKVSSEYALDQRLSLIYVPQMTSNGIEGHFNGVPVSTLLNSGNFSSESEFENSWVNSVEEISEYMVNIFPEKAIAIELHNLLNRENYPLLMIDKSLDPKFKNQLGIAIWWLSGKDDYQSEILNKLKDYKGDIYAQLIGNSSQPDRFKDGEIASAIYQAEELCVRYIEPWNYEFENNTINNELEYFNIFSKNFK